MLSNTVPVIVPVHKGRHRFTLENALKYCAEENDYCMLAHTIVYNIPLRDELRKIGAKKLVEDLKAMLPADVRYTNILDIFAAEHEYKPIGKFDIQLYGVNDRFKISGHTFFGLKSLKNRSELVCRKIYNELEFRPRIVIPFLQHVGMLYEKYPCFDSGDFATEDRCYQNYIIRNNAITEDELGKVYYAPGLCNIEKIRENMDLALLPLVYYDGNCGYIKVATMKRDEDPV